MCVHTLPLLDDNPPQHITTTLAQFYYKRQVGVISNANTFVVLRLRLQVAKECSWVSLHVVKRMS